MFFSFNLGDLLNFNCQSRPAVVVKFNYHNLTWGVEKIQNGGHQGTHSAHFQIEDKYEEIVHYIMNKL
jgi:hypothetical protein